MPATRLLLISRDNILAVMDSEHGDHIFRQMAALTRQQGFHLLATAPQPDQWKGEHGSPDDALLGPNSIRMRLSDAGGVLDGVYYVRRSMLTQKRNRVDSLLDMLQRYATKPKNAFLLSSSRSFVKAADKLGLQAKHLARNHDLAAALERLSESGTVNA